MAKTRFLSIGFAVGAMASLLFTGCTVIGFGIGCILDVHPSETLLVANDAHFDVRTGDEVKITRTDSAVVTGVYRGCVLLASTLPPTALHVGDTVAVCRNGFKQKATATLLRYDHVLVLFNFDNGVGSIPRNAIAWISRVPSKSVEGNSSLRLICPAIAAEIDGTKGPEYVRLDNPGHIIKQSRRKRSGMHLQSV